MLQTFEKPANDVLWLYHQVATEQPLQRLRVDQTSVSNCEPLFLSCATCPDFTHRGIVTHQRIHVSAIHLFRGCTAPSREWNNQRRTLNQVPTKKKVLKKVCTCKRPCVRITFYLVHCAPAVHSATRLQFGKPSKITYMSQRMHLISSCTFRFSPPTYSLRCLSRTIVGLSSVLTNTCNILSPQSCCFSCFLFVTLLFLQLFGFFPFSCPILSSFCFKCFPYSFPPPFPGHRHAAIGTTLCLISYIQSTQLLLILGNMLTSILFSVSPPGSSPDDPFATSSITLHIAPLASSILKSFAHVADDRMSCSLLPLEPNSSPLQ